MLKLNSWFKVHTHLLVLLGLLGLFYFYFYEQTLFFFIAFFFFLIVNSFLNISFLCFFGFKWFDKYNDSEKDKTFIDNANKAYTVGIRTFATIVIVCMLSLEAQLFSFLSVTMKYVINIATMAMAFSVCSVLYNYLLAKYEKESRNEGLKSGLK